MTAAQPFAELPADAVEAPSSAATGGATASSYAVLPADRDADAGHIRSLWQRNLPEVPTARYDWLYRSGVADAWLLTTPPGHIVGSAGLMRRGMRLFGEPRRAAQAVDLNVDREHRFASPALKLQRAITATVRSRENDLVYCFANPQSTALMRRAGYRPIAELQRWVKPLRFGSRLGSRWHCGPVRRLATGLAVSLVRLASPETYRYRGRTGRVQVIDAFDARFDALWAVASARFPAVGERTAAYLDWRFGQCPAARHEILGLTGADGGLAAYVVYRRDKGFAHLADFFYANPSDFRVLLAEFLRRMRRARMEAVVALWLGTSEVTETLHHFGFWRRRSGLSTMIHADPNRLGVAAAGLFDVENWCLTAADFDFDVD